ncbi:GNAT family N-acetyltransferase [Micromonospora sp. WMMD1155]|uniref:GNAT family N-acetyltransferase n=1 Tax=Micromonospora sp. WMMD1155 TaxID=3016094 RepID=UPI00249B64A8|nr:GNAT family N-acetyltransferase [Micromonospora sp. WMMD1155]WFE48840.1 GNAT family N-acetyltransferase [Micromonospora sp. WMMD1155]
MIEVRQPTPVDLDALADILNAFELDCDPEGLQCWVAVESGTDGDAKVIGGVLVDFDYGDYGSTVPSGHGDNHPFIFAIAVASEGQRKGAGRALMRRVAEGAHAAGLSFLVLMPQERRADDASEHIAFFRACGLNALAPEQHMSPYGASVLEILERLRLDS